MKKKVLVLSTFDTNGAGDAMFKIAEVLIDLGCEVLMVVKHKSKQNDFIKAYNNDRAPSIVRRVYNKVRTRLGITAKHQLKAEHKYLFLSKDEVSENIDVQSFLGFIGFVPEFIFTGLTVDFINSTDLLNIYTVTQAKIFNITVDMNHFTGGCHYSWGCEGYINGCNNDCPAILSEHFKDQATINFNAKLHNVQKGSIKVIAGSGLTLQQAKASKIYKNQEIIYNINSVIDTRIMNAKFRTHAKSFFNLASGKFYILLGAYYLNDERKGFKYLVDALNIIYDQSSEELRNRVCLLVVTKYPSNDLDAIRFNKKYIDFITDYRLLSILYQASDLFVNTSIEDSGPMMVSEALACGTPVVGFDTGILINMVENGRNGFKVPVGNSGLLSEGIRKIILLTKEEYNQYSNFSVKMVEEYSSYEYAKNIFSKILTSKWRN